MHLPQKPNQTLLIVVLLATITLAAFWPVTSHDFITYDDTFYLTENPHVQEGLTWPAVGWAFRTGETGNWHPLTWLSHMADVQLYGLKAGGHHLTSLLLHVANTVLLFLVLRTAAGARVEKGRASVPVSPGASKGGTSNSEHRRSNIEQPTSNIRHPTWRCAMVAALFALHPLHVQSVAWASERKDVLSAFFFMLTLWAYVRYAQANAECGARPIAECGLRGAESKPTRSAELAEQNKQHATRNTLSASRFTFHVSLYYFLSLTFFALGLMSKPMLVTVPFVLLLLDYWPLNRVRSVECGMRIPRFTFHVSLLTEKLPFFLLSAASCAVTWWAQSGGGAVVPVEVLSLPQRLANAVASYGTYLVQTVWPVHLAILYPFSRVVSVGEVAASGAVLVAASAFAVWHLKSRPYLAVGWFWFLGMLVPVIGLVQVGMQQTADRYTYLPLIGVFVLLTWEPWERFGGGRSARVVLGILACLLVSACGVATRYQLTFWENSENLFARALEVGPKNYIVLDNYGRALLKQGKMAEAIEAFTEAVELRPDLDASRCGLGAALMEQGKLDEAAAQFRRVLELQPDHVPARLQLGIALGRQGKLTEAEQALFRVLELRPNDAGAHNNLGNVLAAQGNHAQAVHQFEEALRLQPGHAGAYNNLGLSYAQLGREEEAARCYRRALGLQPESVQALNNLAWLLATCPEARIRGGAEAVDLATRACELGKYMNPVTLATLAAAYAEVGRFGEAVSFLERAQELGGPADGPLGKQLASMLQQFQAGRAYRTE